MDGQLIWYRTGTPPPPKSQALEQLIAEHQDAIAQQGFSKVRRSRLLEVACDHRAAEASSGE